MSSIKECPICLDILKVDKLTPIATTIPCNHAYHERCIKAWISTSDKCPICRRILDKVLLQNGKYKEISHDQKPHNELPAGPINNSQVELSAPLIIVQTHGAYTGTNATINQLNSLDGLDHLNSEPGEMILNSRICIGCQVIVKHGLACDNCEKVFHESCFDGENCPFCGSGRMVRAVTSVAKTKNISDNWWRSVDFNDDETRKYSELVDEVKRRKNNVVEEVSAEDVAWSMLDQLKEEEMKTNEEDKPWGYKEENIQKPMPILNPQDQLKPAKFWPINKSNANEKTPGWMSKEQNNKDSEENDNKNTVSSSSNSTMLTAKALRQHTKKLNSLRIESSSSDLNYIQKLIINRLIIKPRLQRVLSEIKLKGNNISSQGVSNNQILQTVNKSLSRIMYEKIMSDKIAKDSFNALIDFANRHQAPLKDKITIDAFGKIWKKNEIIKIFMEVKFISQSNWLDNLISNEILKVKANV